MANIKEFIKDGKKLFKVNNLYLGINPYKGTEVRKSGTFNSRKEANLFISRMKLEFEKGELFGINKRQTFKEVYDLWLETYKRTVKESTLNKRVYNSEVVLQHFGNTTIKKITRIDCQQFINRLADKGYTKGYISCKTTVLKLVLKYAFDNDIITKNPSINLDLPKTKQNKEIKYYNKEELIKFLDIVKKNYNKQHYLIFSLLAHTGARISEILALSWSDIDFNKNEISINKTLADGLNYKVVVQTPKSQASIRTIDVDPELIQELRRFKLEQAEQILKQGKQNKGIVFPNENYSKYVRRETIRNKLKFICKEHNLKYINPHGFRHTHCSLLFEAGVPIQVVQERLGHSNIKTTMDIYNHVTEKLKAGTGANFAKYLKVAD